MASAENRKPRTFGIIAIALLILVWLGGCTWFLKGMGEASERAWGPERSEYVGVWASYLASANDHELNTASIEDAVSFICLADTGEAELVVKSSASAPSVINCRWVVTHRDKSEGTKTGIQVIGTEEAFQNSYQYFEDPDTKLIDESLIDGKLVIDYGYRKEYFEKISNDAKYQPWLEDGQILESEKADDINPSSISSDSIPASAISWQDAKGYIGKSVSIYGPVVEVEYASASKGKPTFIDIGEGYPGKNRVTITIWGKNRASFSGSPEDLYSGKTVCVTGELYLYNGVCNVEVQTPSQIEIL